MSIDALDLTKSALIVIDLQNAFCHPKGTLGQSGLDTERLGAIIPHIRPVIETCRQAEMPVLWTVQEHLETDRRRARKKLPAHTSKRAGVSALAGSWDAEIVDELKDLVSDPWLLIRKHRFGGFYETRMQVVLEQLGVESVFIVGATINACVETTIREAYLRDYDVAIIEDCVSGVRPEWEQAAKEVWRHYLGVTCTSDEFIAWIERQQEPRVRSLHHLLLMASDLEKSKEFYLGLLGFKPRANAKPLPDGREFVSTEQGLGITAGGQGTQVQIDHIAFEVNDVRALSDKLKSANVQFERELGNGPYGLSIYIKDPDGNILELFEAAD